MKQIVLFLSVSISISALDKWSGDHYQSTCRPQFKMAEFAISQLPTRRYNAILDIGCGSGDFTKELTQYAPFVLGIDYSESMISKAQSLYGNSDNVSFATGDMRLLSGITQQFDLITAFHTLQWIPAEDQHRAFERISQLLNPKGLCLILVSDRFNIFYEPLMKMAKSAKWQRYIPLDLEPWNWQTVTSMSNSFSQVGLRPLRVFIWYHKYYLETKEGFYNFMRNWLPNANHFRYIPEKEREELFNEVLEEFLNAISYRGTGPVEFECPFVVAIGEK